MNDLNASFKDVIKRWPAIGLTLCLVSISSLASSPIGHWLFHSDRQQSTKKFTSITGQSGRIVGRPRFANDPAPVRMTLDGTSRLVLAEGATEAISLPKEAITVSTWVQVKQPAAWGGILSAVQDNGQDESGWVLGYRGSRFSFALATEKGGALTYLTATSNFETDRWYHVTGSYDGSELRLYINGKLDNSSTAQQGPILYPNSLNYEIGAYHDRDEDYPMVGSIHEIKLFDRALTPSEITSDFSMKGEALTKPTASPIWLQITAGPFADWVDRTTVRISWEVDQSMPGIVEIHHPDGGVRRVEQSRHEKAHSVVLENLDPRVEYEYRILGNPVDNNPVMSPLYRFDATFYYTANKNLPDLDSHQPESFSQGLAQRILDHTGVTQGYCIVLGAESGNLALELIRESDLEVVILERDREKVNQIRRHLDDAGVYGVRATVQHLESATLPHGAYLANLVVSESMALTGTPPDISFEEAYRIARPTGGILYLGSSHSGSSYMTQLKTWVSDGLEPEVKFSTTEGTWMALRRTELEGAGDWSHQYASADNSACSKDELVQGDLGVLWWGDPGPRPMPDRGGRNPAPLSVNGRMYVQGNRILFGMDAYNGTVLWSKSVPEIRRANVPRASSNMVANDNYLYIIQGRYCLGIEGQRGDIYKKFEVSGHTPEEPQLWGYLANVENLLVGTSMKPGVRYTGDDGEWFEEFTPDEVARVTSTRIFGYDQQTGEEKWKYEKGVIINSTITIADGMIFFLESRGDIAMASETNRLQPEQLTDVQLVCLDLNSGQTQWERAHDFSKCEFMVYMIYGNDTLIVTGTDRDKHFHTFAFNTKQANAADANELEPVQVAGTLLWSESHKEDKGHHSGHLQHPLIVADTFYSDQRSFSLRDGKLLRTDLPERRGCGTMSAAQNSIFFRHYFHGQWDLKTDKRVQFEGLRSGCWLGMIPANGLLLAPEASAGCSCANAIQTSIGYIPKHLDRTSFPISQ
jgi:outer membrane protein assembly factor BamB